MNGRWIQRVSLAQAGALLAPVRTHSDMVLVLMKTIKAFLVGGGPPEGREAATLVIDVGKTSRFFVFSDNKYFSAKFPFYVFEDDGVLSFKAFDDLFLDSKVTSEMIRLFSGNSLDDYLDPYQMLIAFEEVGYEGNSIWPLFIKLMREEFGYIRYDSDADNANEVTHPHYHYDVCYSQSAKYKIGLRQNIGHEVMMEW